MKNLIQIIHQFVELTEAEIATLAPLLNTSTYAKNEVVREQHLVEKHIYFVEKGLLCGMFNQDDKEVINWFCAENEFITSINSFNSQTPCFERIVALEETHIYTIHHRHVHELFIKFPIFERLARILTQRYYVDLEERALALQCKSAKERYDHFVQTRPSLMQRISLGQLASYLGVSQETLSRVRGTK